MISVALCGPTAFSNTSPRVVEAAQVDVLLGDGHMVKLLQHFLDKPRVDVRHIGDLIRQSFNFFLTQVFEHLRRMLRT